MYYNLPYQQPSHAIHAQSFLGNLDTTMATKTSVYLSSNPTVRVLEFAVYQFDYVSQFFLCL